MAKSVVFAISWVTMACFLWVLIYFGTLFGLRFIQQKFWSHVLDRLESSKSKNMTG